MFEEPHEGGGRPLRNRLALCDRSASIARRHHVLDCYRSILLDERRHDAFLNRSHKRARTYFDHLYNAKVAKPVRGRPRSMIATLRRLVISGTGALALALIPLRAIAHPHVFVDARAEVLFDAQGRMAYIRNIWEFDPAFSAFATQGLDKNGDGKLSAKELAPLAHTNVTSLKYYGFFTHLSVGNRLIKLRFPDKYFLRWAGGRLTLYFQLPLVTPTRPGPKTTLEIFDPEYFVAFTFMKKSPVILYGAPARCHAEYHPPHALTASIMAALAAVPASQHDLPPALRDAAVGLANIITLECNQ